MPTYLNRNLLTYLLKINDHSSKNNPPNNNNNVDIHKQKSINIPTKNNYHSVYINVDLTNKDVQKKIMIKQILMISTYQEETKHQIKSKDIDIPISQKYYLNRQSNTML